MSAHDDEAVIDADAERMIEAYRVATSPSAGETSRLWTRLVAPAVAPVIATSAVLRVLVGSMLMVGVGATAIALARPEPPRPLPVITQRAPTAPLLAATPSVQPATLPMIPVASPVPVRATVHAETPRATAPIPAPPTTTPAPSLAEEIALLERARVAVGRGDNGTALRLLDEHARTFATGSLVEERSAMRILVLCRAADPEPGRADARSFLALHPTAALASRIRDACDLVTETPSTALPRGEP